MSDAEPARPHLLTDVATLDTVIAAHAAELGDLVGYRNHAYRVLNLCVALGPADADRERIAVAAAYHDLGIWTHGTFDYLKPSAGLAAAHLQAEGKETWIPEVIEMIGQHHKISRYPVVHSLVEPFRRADWIDVSRGLVTFGLARTRVRELVAIWPSAGFIGGSSNLNVEDCEPIPGTRCRWYGSDPLRTSQVNREPFAKHLRAEFAHGMKSGV